jgi:hypothetical protein
MWMLCRKSGWCFKVEGLITYGSEVKLSDAWLGLEFTKLVK